jgi:TrmH family RNA methyltransferase
MAISKARLKLYRSLHQAKARRESGLFLVEGPELIREALQEGWPLEEVLLTHSLAEDPATGKELIRLLKLADVPHEFCSQSDMERLSDTKTPQGVAALARDNFKQDSRTPEEQEEILLICSRISDPGNLGTLLRTADWFGIKTVLLGMESADPFSPKVVRASAGAIFRIRTEVSSGLEERIPLEVNRGRKLFAAVTSGDLLPGDLPGQGLRGLVIGHEKHGLSTEIVARCSAAVRIERVGRTESLNLAVAAGILLHALCRT